MEIEDKITIIEGPPPTFEAVNDGWVFSLHEGVRLNDMSLTRLRAFNGRALVERCHRAWKHGQPIYLEFRNEEGLPDQAPIIAARHVDTENGDLLMLWIRTPSEDVELELHYGSEDEEDDDDDLIDLEIDDLVDDDDDLAEDDSALQN